MVAENHNKRARRAESQPIADRKLRLLSPHDAEIARREVSAFVVECFIRGSAVLESPETGGQGPPRGKSLERRRAWRH